MSLYDLFFFSSNSNTLLTCLMCLCLCLQWKGWHGARLWLPGQLCVAGDDQRDRGEVVLPLQPRKPGHVLWSKTLITSLIDIFTRFLCHVVANFSSQDIRVILCVPADFCSVALQCEYGVCEEVRTPVQLAGQREAAESSPVVHQLPQQMEPASLLSTTVHTSYTTGITQYGL